MIDEYSFLPLFRCNLHLYDIIIAKLEGGELLMPEKLLIIEPQGPQGPKLGLSVSSMEQVQNLDNIVGQLPEDQRKNITKIKEIAEDLSIPVLEP